MADKKAETRRINAAETEIARREAQARDALSVGEDALAQEAADRIIVLEDQCARARSLLSDLDARIATLRDAITKADRKIADLAIDLRAARSGAAARQGMSGAARVGTPCALDYAEEMAARLRSYETSQDDLSEALDELRRDPEGLDARMGEAGLKKDHTDRRAHILKRLSNTDTPRTNP